MGEEKSCKLGFYQQAVLSVFLLHSWNYFQVDLSKPQAANLKSFHCTCRIIRFLIEKAPESFPDSPERKRLFDDAITTRNLRHTMHFGTISSALNPMTVSYICVLLPLLCQKRRQHSAVAIKKRTISAVAALVFVKAHTLHHFAWPFRISAAFRLMVHTSGFPRGCLTGVLVCSFPVLTRPLTFQGHRTTGKVLIERLQPSFLHIFQGEEPSLVTHSHQKTHSTKDSRKHSHIKD